MPTTAVAAISSQADARDALDPEARDQRAGHKARRVHRQHMPLNSQRGIGHRMAAADHRQRALTS